MGSSIRLFSRQRSVHQILGGGFTADVILWRRRDVTIGILVGTLGAWVLFQLSGYTPLSLLSNVLLLLLWILFVWAKCAEVLNRPPPPIPELHVSEEVMNEAAVFVGCQVNSILSVFHDIALGKDPKLFQRVATCLLLISVVRSCTDFLSFACSGMSSSWNIMTDDKGNYHSHLMKVSIAIITFCFLAGLVILLTFPVLYEKFEDKIDGYVILALIKLHMYEKVYAECFDNAKEWILKILMES